MIWDNRLSINPNALFTSLDNALVLVNIDSEKYFSLDEVGAQAWKCIELNMSNDQIVQKLLTEYDIEEEQLKGDLLDLFTELNSAGLVDLGA